MDSAECKFAMLNINKIDNPSVYDILLIEYYFNNYCKEYLSVILPMI